MCTAQGAAHHTHHNERCRWRGVAFHGTRGGRGSDERLHVGRARWRAFGKACELCLFVCLCGASHCTAQGAAHTHTCSSVCGGGDCCCRDGGCASFGRDGRGAAFGIWLRWPRSRAPSRTRRAREHINSTRTEQLRPILDSRCTRMCGPHIPTSHMRNHRRKRLRDRLPRHFDSQELVNHTHVVDERRSGCARQLSRRARPTAPKLERRRVNGRRACERDGALGSAVCMP